MDNRYLKEVEGVHKVAPWYNDNTNEVKSYAAGAFILPTEHNVLCEYLKGVLLNYVYDKTAPSISLPLIYGFNLPHAIKQRAHQYIADWPVPCDKEQLSKTNNCILSSYNLGLSIRYGKEISKWLISCELKFIPSLQPSNIDISLMSTINHAASYREENARTEVYSSPTERDEGECRIL